MVEKTKSRKSKKRVKTRQLLVRLEPKEGEAFDEYCDRTGTTKSDVLREYIDFLLEHPEIEVYLQAKGKSHRELLEQMWAMVKKLT